MSQGKIPAERRYVGLTRKQAAKRLEKLMTTKRGSASAPSELRRLGTMIDLAGDLEREDGLVQAISQGETLLDLLNSLSPLLSSHLRLISVRRNLFLSLSLSLSMEVFVRSLGGRGV